MSRHTDALHVARRLSMTTPNSKQLRTETIWFWDGEPPHCRILLPWQAWEQVTDEGLFGISDETLPADLIPDHEVILAVSLDSDTELPATQERLKTRLAHPDDPLRSTATWTVTEVTQSEPLPDERELTETVFATKEDADPKSHVGGFKLRQSTDSRRVPESHVPGQRQKPESEMIEQTADTTDQPENNTVEDELKLIISELETFGYSYTISDEIDVLRLSVATDNTEVSVSVEPIERDSWWAVTAQSDKTVPETDRQTVAMKLTDWAQAEWRGRFELERDTGSLSFRVPVQPAEEPVVEAIQESVTAITARESEIDE